jgi:hypothetical protein
MAQKVKREIKKPLVKQLLAEGKTRAEVVEATGVSYNYVGKIDYDRSKVSLRPEIEKMLAEGKSTQDIVKALGCTRQRVIYVRNNTAQPNKRKLVAQFLEEYKAAGRSPVVKECIAAIKDTHGVSVSQSLVQTMITEVFGATGWNMEATTTQKETIEKLIDSLGSAINQNDFYDHLNVLNRRQAHVLITFLASLNKAKNMTLANKTKGPILALLRKVVLKLPSEW